MIIAVPKETAPGETRVALTPDGVRSLIAAGAKVLVESGAGVEAASSDSAYESAGATVFKGSDLSQADVVLQVLGPSHRSGELIGRLRSGAVLISFMFPAANPGTVGELARRGVTCFAMDLLPRISRAQSMDALSSMSTLAGYKSVVLAANALPKFFPMLMTAAGSIAPARVLVIGAGVAGLQAIATARRLGAVVEAFDVRPAVKEQVLSLGAKFIDLGLSAEEAEGAGGYAKEVSEDVHAHETRVIGERVLRADVVIATALVPGRRAPILVTDEMVKTMAKSSVIVDLAAPAGGNCEATVPGEMVEKYGVTIIGPMDLARTMPVHASQMYSKNITAFTTNLMKNGELAIDLEDQIIRESMLTNGGAITNDAARQLVEAGER